MEDENTSRYKDQPKNLGRGVQTAPERERNFWSPKANLALLECKRYSKRAKFSLVGLWPNGLRVTIRHTLFDIFQDAFGFRP